MNEKESLGGLCIAECNKIVNPDLKNKVLAALTQIISRAECDISSRDVESIWTCVDAINRPNVDFEALMLEMRTNHRPLSQILFSKQHVWEAVIKAHGGAIFECRQALKEGISDPAVKKVVLDKFDDLLKDWQLVRPEIPVRSKDETSKSESYYSISALNSINRFINYIEKGKRLEYEQTIKGGYQESGYFSFKLFSDKGVKQTIEEMFKKQAAEAKPKSEKESFVSTFRSRFK